MMNARERAFFDSCAVAAISIGIVILWVLMFYWRYL
jgi:hypothetical protein